MPKLHKRCDRDSHYVLTRIRGHIITFQLTPQGERRLTSAGIASGQQFARALLLDLYRSGDAYTGGGGVEEVPSISSQLELDFASDPDPDTAFPACDDCDSVIDLHFTMVSDGDAKLQCSRCRGKASRLLDVNIPVPLLSRQLLSRLFELKTVKAKSQNVTRFEDLLRAEFESKWGRIRRHRGAAQSSLFDSPDVIGSTDLPLKQ
jgi:hypothetical protein